MNHLNYLPHLKNSLPSDVSAHQISFYSVALEAWRRGLKVKYYNRNRGGKIPSLAITYSLSDEDNEYYFVCARGSKSEREAILKAENKSSAYKYLERSGVPIPKSRTFNYNDSTIEEMCEYGKEIGYPLVIKPTNMGGGKGVVTHIDSIDLLKESLLNAKNHLKVKKIIIEKYFENGVDYRFYVIGEKVLAVTKSYSSYVIGNNKNSLKELIKKQNIKLRNNPATKLKIINIDKNMLQYLEENNMTLDYIPEAEERVFLRKHGTYLGKRINVDCTKTVDSKFKKYAVNALNSIPGLPTGSVDMIINEEANEGIVNEINTKGEITMHLFPSEGEAVDIPKHLVDYYFPKSKKINDNFYFEYKPVKDLFLDGYGDEITIPAYPKGTHFSRNFIIDRNELQQKTLMKLKRKAANLSLKGYIKLVSQNKTEIYTIGTKENIVEFENFIRDSRIYNSKSSVLSSTQIEEFNGVSTIGLEIIDEKTVSNNNNLIKDRVSKKYSENLQSDNQNAETNYTKTLKNLQSIKSSNSWKFTRQIKKLKSKINRK